MQVLFWELVAQVAEEQVSAPVAAGALLASRQEPERTNLVPRTTRRVRSSLDCMPSEHSKSARERSRSEPVVHSHSNGFSTGCGFAQTRFRFP